MLARRSAGLLVAAILLAAAPVVAETAAPPAGIAWVDIPGAQVVVGDAEAGPDETFREVEVAPFRLMRHEVTNRQFAAFVEASGHLTDPERAGSGWVWPGRWERVAGAEWRHPFGPESTIEGRGDHPVVQVSADDAAAFCRFHGWRLPSEAEWMLAAGGVERHTYPWGEAPPQQGEGAQANFGTLACCAADDGDGFRRTAPVGRFPAGRSPFGVDDMAGNVWEWTASPMPGRPGRVVLKGGGWGNDPFCLRIPYRHHNPPDIGLDMVGFRCAADPAP